MIILFSKKTTISISNYNMTEKENKLEALNRILESKDFQSSKTKRKLLCYLVDAAINNKEIKEFTIASEVFEKKDFNPGEDSSVRVYISNLRKKLEDYYREEGAQDKVKIHIPKGHYEVVFIDSETKQVLGKDPSAKKYKYLLYGSSLTIILLIISFIIVLIITKSKSYDNNFIWTEFNNSENQKTLVLGNDLFYLEGEPENERIVRKHSINTATDFENFKSAIGNEKVKQITPYPFFPISSISSIPAIFSKANLTNCILLASAKTTLNDLLNNDIVFLGSFRNLFLLERLLRDNYIKYNLIQNHISLTINNPDSIKTLNLFGEPGSEHSDYCLLRKIPGPNNNTIIMFISFFDTGMRAAMNFINNNDEIKQLETSLVNKFGTVPKYFDVIFKVSGYSRTALKIHVEEMHMIDPAKLKIWE